MVESETAPPSTGSQPDVVVSKRPPLIARLRLPLGYVAILAAFFVNDGRFIWWALGLVFLGSALRMWSAGTLIKTRELTTTGPYAISRNPLYLGTFLAGVGLALFVHSAALFVFFVVTFGLSYTAQINWEEKLLYREHGQPFKDYCKKVGRYFSPGGFLKDAWRSGFSWLQMLKNKELAYQVFWCVMILGLVSQAYLQGHGISFVSP